VRASRDGAKVSDAIQALRNAAADPNVNTMPFIIDAVRTYASVARSATRYAMCSIRIRSRRVLIYRGMVVSSPFRMSRTAHPGSTYFSLVTPLKGLSSDFRSMNRPVSLSRLVQSSVLGL